MIERTPLACDLTDLNEDERRRRDELIATLRPAMVEVRNDENGFCICFDPAVPLAMLAELIGLERRCCPFLTFGLVVPEANGPVRLEITGREAVEGFLIAELRLPGAAVE